MDSNEPRPHDCLSSSSPDSEEGAVAAVERPESIGQFLIEVDGPTLRRELAEIDRWLSPEQLDAEASIWLESGVAVIRVGDSEARMPASGSWPERVVLRAGALVRFQHGALKGDRVTLLVDGGHLRLGEHSTMKCRVTTRPMQWPRFIGAGASLGLLDALSVTLTHSAEDIRYSGLSPAVERAYEAFSAIVERCCYAAEEEARELGRDADDAADAVRTLLWRGLRPPRLVKYFTRPRRDSVSGD